MKRSTHQLGAGSRKDASCAEKSRPSLGSLSKSVPASLEECPRNPEHAAVRRGARRGDAGGREGGDVRLRGRETLYACVLCSIANKSKGAHGVAMKVIGDTCR